MLRGRLALALVVAGAVLAALAAVVAGTRRDAGPPPAGAARPASASAPATSFAGAVRPPGMPPARFALRDQDGHRVTAASLRGRGPVVVTFLYTHCRDTCPLTAQQIRGALDRLGHPVPVVAVSVDPTGDTPASARSFLARQGLSGRFAFLLGSRAELAPVWRAFGVRPQRVDAEHSADTVLLDGRGVQRVGYQVSVLSPEALAHDVRVLERGA